MSKDTGACPDTGAAASPRVSRCGGPGFVVDQRGDGRVAAQLVQAAAACRSDTADRDAQPGADLGIWHRWVFDEHGNQLLAGRGQVGERLAQCRVALRHQQLLLSRPGLLVGDVLGAEQLPGRLRSARRIQDPVRIPAALWWLASQEARPDRGLYPGGSGASARRSARRPRRRLGPAGGHCTGRLVTTGIRRSLAH
jgi:hypothetical protein